MTNARWRSSRVKTTVAALTVAAGLSVAWPAAASGSACVTWTGPQPVNVSNENSLNGALVLSPCSVWAAGVYNAGGGAQTLIEHWNGAAWSQTPSPDPGGANGTFAFSVAGSSRRVWTVGYYLKGGTARTLVLYWTGSAWKQASSPNVGAGPNELLSVAATSARDAWAVGDYYTGTRYRSLVLRWNGTSWRTVPSPSPGNADFLHAVAATSAGNAWAVGEEVVHGLTDRTLIMHWNGRSWRAVPSPNLGGAAALNFLQAVTVTSARDAWAVGNYLALVPPARTLILHWNGRSWRVVRSPNAGGTPESNQLVGVTATSARNAWAVGSHDSPAGMRTLIQHWNGKSWSIVPSPNLGVSGNVLAGVSAASPSELWAVGSDYTGSIFAALAIHCC